MLFPSIGFFTTLLHVKVGYRAGAIPLYQPEASMHTPLAPMSGFTGVRWVRIVAAKLDASRTKGFDKYM